MDDVSKLWRFYQEHRGELFAYAMALTGNTALAEDAVHDAVVAVAGGNGRVRRLRPYLFRTLRHECFRLLKDNAKRLESEAPLGAEFLLPGGAAGNPEDRARMAEARARLSAGLQALPAEQREAIVLRVYSQLKFREIAAVLGKPLPTVASHYRRGLRNLGKHFEEIEDEG